MHGVLVIDKPAGCTSHDVVQRVRRLLNTRRVGHAGTLDPLATGVLVIAVGEATKLVPYLQSADKRYEVTVRFGGTTDTLDADGRMTEERPVPGLTVALIEQALAPMLGTHAQEVPAYSAVKVEGKALHRRARAGESIDAPSREVTLHEAAVGPIEGHDVTLSLHCSKGFFVRSLARDLAMAIGTVGHVVALRRTASGAFTLDSALTLEALAQVEDPQSALLSLEKASADLAQVRLTVSGVEDAGHGRAISSDGAQSAWPPPATPLALLSPEGKLVAIGRLEGDLVRIARGIVRTELVGG